MAIATSKQRYNLIHRRRMAVSQLKR